MCIMFMEEHWVYMAYFHNWWNVMKGGPLHIVTCRVTIPDRGPYPGPSRSVILLIDTHSIVSFTAFPYAC
jgi:hypothetical protein